MLDSLLPFQGYAQHAAYDAADLTKAERKALQQLGFKQHGHSDGTRVLYHPTHWTPSSGGAGDLTFFEVELRALTPEAHDFVENGLESNN